MVLGHYILAQSPKLSKYPVTQNWSLWSCVSALKMCFCAQSMCVCVCVCVHMRTLTRIPLPEGNKSWKGDEDGQVITLPFKILKRGIYDNHIVIYLLKHKNMEA